MEKRFRRQELHDLVWSEPLASLAPRFGISDTALAKTCRRHGIPTPGRGHWAKLKAGKPSPRFPLPPRGLGNEETICLGRTLPAEREAEEQALVASEIQPPPEFAESLSDLLTRIANLVGHVPPSKRLNSPHREIAALLAVDEKRRAEWLKTSYRSSYGMPFFTSPYEQRRLKLLDAIFKAVSKAGMRPSMQRLENPEEFRVDVGHTHMTFSLGKPGEQRSTINATSDLRRPVSEHMHLEIRWWVEKPEGLTLSWTDAPDTPLETQLPEIVAHLIASAEMRVRIHEYQQYQWRVDRKARIIEAERQHRLEVEREERARLRRLEKARIDKLLGEAMSLRLADDVRAYVAAVTARNAEEDEPIPATEMATWTQWALAQADRIDPVRSRAFLQPVPQEEDAEEDEADSARAGQGRAGTTVHLPAASPWHPNRWYTRLHR